MDEATAAAAAAFQKAHPEGGAKLLAKLKGKASEPVHPRLVALMQPRTRAGRTGRSIKTPATNDPASRPVSAPRRGASALPEPPSVGDPIASAAAQAVTPAGQPEPHANTVSAGAVVQTREAWMLRAVAMMRPWLPEDVVVPDVRISFGWPGGRGPKKDVRGQCWYTTDDSLPAIFVSPDQHDPVTVLGIILHEMIHASGQRNHRPGSFGKVAAPLGFGKPFTSSQGKTDELVARLSDLAEQLGPIDHSRVNSAHGLYGTGPERPPVQSTRMVKLSCPACGYTVRATRRWIEVGLPSCPSDEQPLEPDKDELARLDGES